MLFPWCPSHLTLSLSLSNFKRHGVAGSVGGMSCICHGGGREEAQHGREVEQMPMLEVVPTKCPTLSPNLDRY